MGFRLSRTAENDLISIYVEGARQFGTRQADAYHDSLDRLFRFLGRHPEAAPERREISPPVRCHPHAPHIVIYRVDTDGDALILRIRHAREDWEADP